MSPEAQNRDVSGPKKDLCPPKIKKKTWLTEKVDQYYQQ